MNRPKGSPEACAVCGSSEFHCTRRQNAVGGWRVTLQCGGCGKAYESGVKVSDHPGFMNYPVFNPDRHDGWVISRDANEREKYEAEREERRSEYNRWLEESPEWKELRAKVLSRDKNVCQACLCKPAAHVHHLTYDYGRLPPAFELQSVCAECHVAVHDTTLWRDMASAREDARALAGEP